MACSKDPKETTEKQKLISAVENNNLTEVLSLLGQGNSFDTRDDKAPYSTILMMASYSDYLELVCELVKKADLNLTNRSGGTALTYAAWAGNHKIMQVLIDNGADINKCDELGFTALMYSSRDGHDQCVHILLQYRCDLNIVDNKGRTAKSLALTGNHTNIVELLKKASAEDTLNKRENKGNILVSLLVPDCLLYRK